MSGDIWRLRYEGVDFPFGDGEQGIYNERKPDVNAWEEDVDDRRNPLSDGVYPGEDFIAGQVVSFALSAVAKDRDAIELVRDRFMQVWRAQRVRQNAGAMAELISPRGRSAFGRPRKASPIDTLIKHGLLQIIADFKNMRSAWYGDEISAPVSLVVEAGTGFTFPVTFPLVMGGKGSAQSSINIGGDLETPVNVDFFGPLQNPVVEIGDLRIVLNGTIAYDEVVTVDSFNKKITKNGRSAAGMMPPHSTRLTEMQLPPGSYPIRFFGNSESGTARIVVRARAAYASY